MTKFKLKISGKNIEIFQDNEAIGEGDDYKEVLAYVATLIVKKDIDDLENKKSYIISKDGKPGPVCTKLYNKLRAIQYGDEPDTHNWVTILD